MIDVAKNIAEIRCSLPAGVVLVAVSKFHSEDVILEAYLAGQRVFGESRAQEFVKKASALPADIEWHFIGHLQTNKVRMILPHVAMIQSVDSEKLLSVIDAESARIGKTTDVLLELHVAQEESKYGFSMEDCRKIATCETSLSKYEHVRVRGVMGMATNVDNEEEIRKEFRQIRETFALLKSGVMADAPYFNVVSMGMSHDYPIAVEEGSTMVRVGSRIFGERQY